MPASEAHHDPERDDLGLTLEDWWDLQIAYNYGTLEPHPGTVEAEAFSQMDAYARSEVLRIAAESEAAAPDAPRLRDPDGGEHRET